jgi:bifunctional DNA primase/polymerase-like protein
MATVPFSDTAAGGQAPTPGAVAYACARLGFRVFPLANGTKRPAIEGWKERATADLDQVREWWAGGEFTGCPVGIATGPGSGVWILDLDLKHGVSGFDTLKTLAAANGSGLDAFSGTITVATPSGGAHLYFRWDETADAEGGVRNSSGHVGPGIDVRGIGGLVKAPGCGGYQIVPRGGVRSTVITPAPAWLVKLTRKPPVERSGQHYEPGSPLARRDSERILNYLGKSAPGTRNDALNATAYVLGKVGAMTRDQAWQAVKLVTYSIGANDSEAEQLRTFESGWEAGRRAGNV